ncbi:TonB-dependent receptor domain-containing protein [Croceiramulus getboli]|nr:outer membrane beta-barrel family protein [Flavobacteriaceae bacterium YJPT1-3]
MLYRLPIALFLLFYSISVLAQQAALTGRVVDQDAGIPLEYATITVTDASDPNSVTGGITDTKGNFEIEVEPGTYNISVDYISFQSVKFDNRRVRGTQDLGTIRLTLDAASLNEVTVIAETTTVEVRLDKKIYNIGKDITASGGTVSDALNNVPSVTVDVEGAIALRGNENVRILINGRPSAIAGFGSTDALRQLPAEAIERVEVITSPSARYDAEGTAGILNIILRKEKTLGFNGSVRANYGFPLTAGLNTNFNIRTDKFNIFNNTGIRYRESPGNAFFENTFLTDRVENQLVIEDRIYDRQDQGFNTNLGFEYFITERSSITATGFLRLGDDEDITTNNTREFDEAELLRERTVRTEFETENDESFQVALNYVNNFDDNGHKLTADFQYANDNEEQTSFIGEEAFFPDRSRLPAEDIISIEEQKEYLIQADYVRPLGENAQFEAGYRGNFENTVTDYTLLEEEGLSGIFVQNDSLTNVFEYQQDVHALYTQYGNKLGKFNFLLGLRMETTGLRGEVSGENVTNPNDEFNINFDKDYIGLFPTVNIIYEFSDDENMSFGYNRRINRPRGFFINPFPSRSSEANVFQGNPDLDPAYANAFDLGYLKKWKELTLTSSVYYQRETNSFERIQEDTGQTTPNGIPIIRRIPINLSTNERYGFEAGVLYNPAKWLRLNGSVNVFGFKTEGDFNGISYDTENTSWFGRFSSKVTLPAKIDWQTNAFYRGPNANAQTETEGIFSLDLAVSKDFMDDNATISFNVNDFYNSRKRRSFTETDSFLSRSEFQWRERSFNLALTYRFNEKKKRNGRGGDGFGGDDDFEGTP